MRRVRLFLALPALVLLAACGSGDDGPTLAAGDEDRTVEIEMRDIAFSPAALEVRRGEKVRFVFTNTGQIAHDAFIGDAAAQEVHETDARGGHGHAAGDAIEVKPGRKGQLIHTFDQPGEILIGCHEPGHYEGGMKVVVTVL